MKNVDGRDKPGHDAIIFVDCGESRYAAALCRACSAL